MNYYSFFFFFFKQLAVKISQRHLDIKKEKKQKIKTVSLQVEK